MSRLNKPRCSGVDDRAPEYQTCLRLQEPSYSVQPAPSPSLVQLWLSRIAWNSVSEGLGISIVIEELDDAGQREKLKTLGLAGPVIDMNVARVERHARDIESAYGREFYKEASTDFKRKHKDALLAYKMQASWKWE
ncbi:hypothetical protein F66182_5778 [Fusarium sp. NRRL 66182]|nr:hypothetical protein F66182_5778 [Fusarium sp. NRRL 66182]